MDYEGLFRKFENKGAEFLDLRVLNSNSEAVLTEDEKVNSIQDISSVQFGARVFYKGAWGFSYTNDAKKLEGIFSKAFKLAKLSSKKSEKFEMSNVPVSKAEINSKGISSIDVDIGKRIKILLDAQKKFKLNPIKNKKVDGVFSKRGQRYVNSFGSDVFEERDYINIAVSITGKKGSKIRRSFERIGEVANYNVFKKINFDALADALEKRLKNSFIAESSPAGKMPIVTDNVLTHVFFHEAVGHACEADSVIEKSSVLADKLGEKIAPDFLTMYDTPKIKNEHGFYEYDDEGVKAGKTMLIKKGRLVGYLHSLETANKLRMDPTGNGRAESAFSQQIPRMSNTVLANGNYKFEELFKGIKKGVYAKNSLGGVVEPTTGNFLFNAREAYLIENGRITKPLLGVSFGGNILNTLMKIERIANDQKPSFGGWRCGKDGQMVPVGGAAPHIMLSEAMVGGNK